MYESSWSSSIWKTRVSRRRALRGAALGAAGLGGAALIGCGDAEDGGGTPGGGATSGPATSAASGDPVRGGNLRVAHPADTNTLDPALTLSTGDIAITQNAFDNLVLVQNDLSIRPMLAESLEPNGDLTEYVATLRQGVKFHHGKELEARDVVHTFERLLDPATGSAATSSLASIERIEEVDAQTVRFVLNGPSAFLPDALSIYQARIMASDLDPSTYATDASGTGPFRVVEHRPQERTRLERNAEYWDGDLPHLDSATFLYMAEPATRLEALRSGSVDAIDQLEPAQIGTLESSGFVVNEQASTGYMALAMRNDRAPFDDIRVRQALQALTDREFLIEAALYGRGTPGNDHSIAPFDPHFWDGQAQPGYDPQRANELLSAAGQQDLSITLHTSAINPGNIDLAIAFRELAQQSGVTVEVRRQPEDAYWVNVWLVEPFTVVSWNGRSADEALSIVYHSEAPWNEAYYVNPQVDELLAKARGIPDPEERTETYGQIEQILIDDVPRLVPLFKPNFLGHAPNVGGLTAHPNNWLLMHNAWIDV